MGTIRHKYTRGPHHEGTRKGQSTPSDNGQASALAIAVLLLVTCLGVSGFSIQVIQPTSTDTDLQQFVGGWHAKFKRQDLPTVNLDKQRGNLTGIAVTAKSDWTKTGSLQARKNTMVATLSWKPSLPAGYCGSPHKEQDSGRASNAHTSRRHRS